MSDNAWKCQSCGCEFPRIAGDKDVARCTRCVEVEQQGIIITRQRERLAELEGEIDRRTGKRDDCKNCGRSVPFIGAVFCCTECWKIAAEAAKKGT